MCIMQNTRLILFYSGLQLLDLSNTFCLVILVRQEYIYAGIFNYRVKPEAPILVLFTILLDGNLGSGAFGILNQNENLPESLKSSAYDRSHMFCWALVAWFFAFSNLLKQDIYLNSLADIPTISDLKTHLVVFLFFFCMPIFTSAVRRSTEI